MGTGREDRRGAVGARLDFNAPMICVRGACCRNTSVAYDEADRY